MGDIVRNDRTGIVWHSGLKAKLEKLKNLTYSPTHIRTAAWRPFVQQFLYGDLELAHRPKIMPTMFPSPDIENRAICVNGVGSTNPLSALIVDIIPDLEFISKGQCFPRYRYERRNVVQGELLGDSGGLTRVDNITDTNITDTALKAFRVQYADNTITKDAIFDYGYGILHAPAWRERFANDLAKELPHIPFAPDFRAFAEAGRALAALHLGYACREYPLEAVAAHGGEVLAEDCRIGERAMRFADDGKTMLIVNDRLRLAGIPPEAHGYEVSGRTPLEWLVDQYRISKGGKSGIVDDPNAWFEDPRDVIAAIRRVVHLSVETVRIVRTLLEPFHDS